MFVRCSHGSNLMATGPQATYRLGKTLDTTHGGVGQDTLPGWGHTTCSWSQRSYDVERHSAGQRSARRIVCVCVCVRQAIRKAVA